LFGQKARLINGGKPSFFGRPHFLRHTPNHVFDDVDMASRSSIHRVGSQVIVVCRSSAENCRWGRGISVSDVTGFYFAEGAFEIATHVVVSTQSREANERGHTKGVDNPADFAACSFNEIAGM
jgi:hypothetical protein